MGEFELIDWLRRRLPVTDPALELGIGDDAAVVAVPPGQRLVITTDTLNEGVHFAPGDDPRAVGHKSLAVSLSDLAAMGAEPRWVLLNLTLPEILETWLEPFVAGFGDLARAHQVTLIGGDSCRGPRAVTVTALGLVEPDQALRRSGARPGDRILVSGWPGLARLALRERLAGRPPSTAAARALDRPIPRVALGRALRGFATACIDLSDGLLADLGHVTAASGCGARIDLARLPCPPELGTMHEAERWDLQLAGGDDYELCFCVPPVNLPLPAGNGHAGEPPLTDIGVICAGSGIRCLRPDGSLFEPSLRGYDHFRS